MKLIKILNNEQEYRKYPALNYSTLKSLSDSIEFISEEKDDTDSLKLGSIVDCLLTSPEDFDDQFIVSDYKPDPSESKLISYVLFNWDEEDLDEEDELSLQEKLLKVADYLELWKSSKKKETRLRKITDDLIGEITVRISNPSYRFVSTDEYERAKTVVNTFKTHPRTRNYFNEFSSVEILYQLPLVFKFGKYDIGFKCMLDIVAIDHKNKVIYPIDVKTMGESLRFFPNKILKWRYDIQQWLYTIGIQCFVKEEFPNYEVAPFKFVVASFNEFDSGKIHKYSIQDPIEFVRRTSANRAVPLETGDELIERYLYHYHKNDYSEPKELIENDVIVL